MNQHPRGVFVVFEGIDCSGTSTQAQLLTAALRRDRRRVFLTSEPSRGPIGQLIRTYFSGRLASSFTRAARDKFFASLFAADRLDHCFNPLDGIWTHLTSGIDVVCTRSKLSSLAYNAETEQERQFVLLANSELFEPDLLIYLRCPVAEALRRMKERVTKETYEKDSSKLQIAFARFERELTEYKGPQLQVDATLPPESLAKEISVVVRELIRARTQQANAR